MKVVTAVAGNGLHDLPLVGRVRLGDVFVEGGLGAVDRIGREVHAALASRRPDNRQPADRCEASSS